MAKDTINSETEEVLSSDEVARRLGVSVATLSRRVKSGQLIAVSKPPLLKRHHRLQFYRAEIEKHLPK
jgi:predicted site-specific integrase-resolvase